jgi:TonB family protein
MSETWKRWEGQVVNGALPLLSYLGGSDHSAVFLTERVGGAPQKAAIKLIRAEAAGAEDQLLRWKQSGKLTHPGLIRLFESGRCELEGTPLLYVVMECTEEDLSQILPERALTPGEAQEMLPPVIKALSHIHAGEFVHGHVKPSNIMATGDQVKLSSDTLRAVEETVIRKGQLSVYDAPEASSGKLSPAADVWALGVTLVEVLTRHPPVWNRAQAAPPALPEEMAEPFREIAHHCLQVDPKQRWTLAQVTGRLKPEQGVAKKAAAPASAIGESKARAKWPIAVGVAVVVIVAALALIPKGSKNSISSPPQQAEVQTQQPPVATPVAPEPSRKQHEPKPSPATRGKTPSVQSGTAATQGAVTKGAVAQQVLPRVSPSARDTIEGKIRVRVRVQVDPSGKVTEARLESAGPSKYFARLALEASRQWTFTPAQVQGRPVASQWILRYGFRRSDTEVVPEQVSP